MSNCCSDTGLQGSSPRDKRFMQFIANGPGIAGFKFEVDPEVDGDAAAQFLAHADMARIEEMNLAVDSHRPRELSLEALAAESGFELADPDSEEAIMAFEDAEEISDLPPHLVAQFDEEDEDGDDGESAIAALDPKYIRPRPEGAIEVFRSREVNEQVNAGRRQGSPRFNTAAICRKAVEAAQLVSKAIVAEESRKAVEAQKATAAKPEPVKGNGNRPTPPVGKFLTGVVIDQGHKGLLVDIGNGLEARVPIADERGHGSWDAAAAWVLGFKPGTKVRVKVVRVLMNGHAIIEAILADRHPRPWWRKKEVNGQVEAPVAN